MRGSAFSGRNLVSEEGSGTRRPLGHHLTAVHAILFSYKAPRAAHIDGKQLI
jgi:hypothetical protein